MRAAQFAGLEPREHLQMGMEKSAQLQSAFVAVECVLLFGIGEIFHWKDSFNKMLKVQTA